MEVAIIGIAGHTYVEEVKFIGTKLWEQTCLLPAFCTNCFFLCSTVRFSTVYTVLGFPLLIDLTGCLNSFVSPLLLLLVFVTESNRSRQKCSGWRTTNCKRNTFLEIVFINVRFI